MSCRFAAITTILLVVYVASAQTFGQLKQQADNYYEAGNYSEALRLYMQMEPMALNQSNARQFVYYAFAGHCCKNLGEYERALSFYSRALVLSAKGMQRDAIVVNMSDVLLQTGRCKKVIETLDSLSVEDTLLIQRRLNNLSVAYQTLANNSKDKREYYSGKALALIDSVLAGNTPCSRYYVTALNNKAYLLWENGSLTEAYALMSEVMRRSSPVRLEYFQMLSNYAMMEAEANHSDSAIQHIADCIEWIGKHYGSRHPDYSICLRKQAKIFLYAGREESALVAYRSYFSAVRDDVIGKFSNMSARQRQDYWNMLRHHVSECFRVGRLDPEFAYDVAVFSKNALVFSGKPADVAGLKATCSDVRSALSGNRDVAIEFVRYSSGETTEYAAVILPKRGNVSFVRLFSQEEIEKFPLKGNARLYGTLEDDIKSDKPRAKNDIFSDKSLETFIWQNIYKAIPAKSNVYFAAEGIFNILGIEYMRDTKRIKECTRLSATSRLLGSRIGKNSLLRSCLTVGGIKYNDATEASHCDSPLPDRTGAIALEEEELVRPGELNFSFLQGSGKETREVEKILRNLDVTCDSSSHATEERMKQILGRYSIMHISTHGYAYHFGRSFPRFTADSIREDRSLAFSGIALSGVNVTAQNNSGTFDMEDGLLTAREVSEIRLDSVCLAVLSACQTGLGRTIDDGLVGMPLGLKKAGVGAIVVSLWPVSDAATQLLMQNFFRILVREPEKPLSQTLNKARRQLRMAKGRNGKRQYDQPYFYNPFIVIDGF